MIEKSMQEAFERYLDELKQIAREEGYDSLDEQFVERLRARYLGQEVVIGQTARVTLREMEMTDLEAFYAFEGALEEPVLQAFLKESEEASREHLKAYLETMYPMYDYGMWTVVERESGEIIGLCGLGRMDCQGAECTDLGYYICPKWRNRGLATECVEFVLDYAKNYLEFSEVYAIIKEENRISAGILRRFCFEYVGREGENIVYCKKLADKE